jgi:hypothetical protein
LQNPRLGASFVHAGPDVGSCVNETTTEAIMWAFKGKKNQLGAAALVASVVLGGYGCGIEKPDDQTSVSRAAVKAAFGDVENDVEKVKFELFACPSAAHPDGDMDGVPDGATAEQTLTSPMGPGFLPDGLMVFQDKPLDSSAAGSAHRYSDGLFVVDADTCKVVRSTPLKGSGVGSEDCFPAAKTIDGVPAGLTKEVVIVNQCKGRPKAIIDAVAALNNPPQLLDVKFTKDKGEPTTKFSSCEPFRICISVIDPDHDPLSWALTEVDDKGAPVSPSNVSIVQAKDYPQTDDKAVSTNCWDVQAGTEGTHELQVVVKDLVWDRMSDPANPKLIPVEDFVKQFQHEDHPSRVQQVFPIHALECEDRCRLGVEIVFTVDTSGSMSDEAAALCNNIAMVQGKLINEGLMASTHLLGIGTPDIPGDFPCLTDTVGHLLGTAVPGNGGACGGPLDSNESWGPSTAIVAQRYPWQAGALRVIVPISDEGACRGNPCLNPGEDHDAVLNAIAQHGTAVVSPIVGTGAPACVSQLASELAAGTGGTSFVSTDPTLDLPGYVTDLVKLACKRK